MLKIQKQKEKTDKDLCPHGAYVLVEKTDNNQNINVCRKHSVLEKD